MSKAKKVLEQYINEHLDRRRFASKTKISYAYWIYRLADFFGQYSLSELTFEDVSEFMRNLDEKEGLSPSTIKQAANSLHFFFNTLGKQNWKIKELRKKLIVRVSHYVPVPTQSEVFAIIDAITSKPPKLAIALIYSTGINLMEVVNIRKVDIDFQNNILHIPTKQKSGFRKAILAEFIKPQLYAYIRQKNPNKWVFEKQSGEQISHSSIQKAVTSSVKKLGLKTNYTVRSLRYAYIKHLEKLGVNLQDILNELGMSHYTSYEFYSKLGQKKHKISISPIDRRITDDILQMQGLGKEEYVSTFRINELARIKESNFDLTKLIQLLHEINVANHHQIYFSIAMLVRAVMDHVPPIFGCNNFIEFSNNYRGTKSFNKSMKNLQNSLRNVADSFLHSKIRKSEVLPTFNQVDFKTDLDVLLSEIVRITK